MSKITVDMKNKTVTVNGETCNFYEAGIHTDFSKDGISEHLAEREDTEEENIVFIGNPEFRVFIETEDFSYEQDIVILRSKDIETKNLCQTYSKYGQKSCCYDAGCYSLENESCCEDVLSEILAEMKISLTDEEKEMDFDELVEKLEKLKGFDKAKEAVENHVACVCYEYWDGSNFRTLTIKTESGETDLVELDDEEAGEILAEYDAVSGDLNYINGVNKTVNCGKHSFFNSRMQGFYPMAVVRDIDEEEEE